MATRRHNISTMSDHENPEAAACIHLSTVPCADSLQPEPTIELADTLRDMIQRRAGRGEDVPRSVFSKELLTWLLRSGRWAFNPQTVHFTEWGGPIMKTAFAALLEYEESRLPVELVVWMRACVVPAVFTSLR